MEDAGSVCQAGARPTLARSRGVHAISNEFSTPTQKEPSRVEGRAKWKSPRRRKQPSGAARSRRLICRHREIDQNPGRQLEQRGHVVYESPHFKLTSAPAKTCGSTLASGNAYCLIGVTFRPSVAAPESSSIAISNRPDAAGPHMAVRVCCSFCVANASNLFYVPLVAICRDSGAVPSAHFL